MNSNMNRQKNIRDNSFLNTIRYIYDKRWDTWHFLVAFQGRVATCQHLVDLILKVVRLRVYRVLGSGFWFGICEYRVTFGIWEYRITFGICEYRINDSVFSNTERFD